MKCPESTATVRSLGQQRVERDRQRARVEMGRVAGVLERRVAPASRRRSRAPARAWRGSPRWRAGGEQRLGGRGGVADDARRRRGGARRALLVEVDLHDLAPRAISAPSRVVQRLSAGAEREHQVGLGHQPRGDRRGEAARDAEGPRVALEQAVAHAEVASTAPIARQALERARAPASTAPRPATIAGPRAAASSVGDLRDRRRRGRGRRARAEARRRPAGRGLAPGRRAAG